MTNVHQETDPMFENEVFSLKFLLKDVFDFIKRIIFEVLKPIAHSPEIFPVFPYFTVFLNAKSENSQYKIAVLEN